MTLPPLRVWLESNYDGGKFGAWLLDVPGAFGSAASRDLAVSQSSVAFGWFRDWLGRHGEALAGAFGFAEVIEDVAATRVDGYERNATFADDTRPSRSTTIRRRTRTRPRTGCRGSRMSTTTMAAGRRAGSTGQPGITR